MINLINLFLQILEDVKRAIMAKPIINKQTPIYFRLCKLQNCPFLCLDRSRRQLHVNNK